MSATAARNETPLILLWSVLVFAALGVVLWKSEHHSIHDLADRASRGEMTAASPDSLVSPARSVAAIQAMEGQVAPEEVVESLYITPVNGYALVRDARGNERRIGVDIKLHVKAQNWDDNST